MFDFHRPLLAALICGAAPAQASAPPEYKSALSGYQPFRDEKPANWRDLNDAVGALGGHRAHLRDSGSAEPGAPGSPARTGDAHAGHGVIAAPAAVAPSAERAAAPRVHDHGTTRMRGQK